MLVDGFTVLAQLFNFLLLVWLLKRYLYRPILNAVDAREKLIAGQLHEAETQKSAALEERRQLETRNEQFAAQRESLLRSAAEEADNERLKLLAEVRNEATALRSGFAAKLASDRLAWEQEFVSRAQQEVFAMIRRALRDLADTSLESSVIRVLVQKVRGLGPVALAALRQQPFQATHPIIVRSSFELDSDARQQIADVIRLIGQADRDMKFETDAALVCGIEILVNGHKVAWSVADYLAQAAVALRHGSTDTSDTDTATTHAATTPR